jgi:hypothetical protein
MAARDVSASLGGSTVVVCTTVTLKSPVGS